MELDCFDDLLIMIFTRTILIEILCLIAIVNLGYADPAPWEEVVVIPTPKNSPGDYQESKDVTVEYVQMKKIVVYVSGFCGIDCDDVKKFLDDHHVVYEEREVFFSVAGISNLLTRGIARVPTTEFIYSNGSVKRVIGFDPKIIGQFIAEEKTSPQNDFGISDFDLRGTNKN